MRPNNVCDPAKKPPDSVFWAHGPALSRLASDPRRHHHPCGWLGKAVGALAVCAALAGVPSAAQAQAEQNFIDSHSGICITGWIKIDDQDTDQGPLAIRAVGQMHTYRSCPTTLGEGGGDASSAPRLNALPYTMIKIWYYDFGKVAWVQCADGGWQTEGGTAWSSANYLIANPECPHQAWLGMTMAAYASLDNGTTWFGSETWSGYYWHD
jgi:hypothetical protein